MASHEQNPSKTDNQCKRCNEHVTNENGLQCKGLCENWAHFDCLKFSDSRIRDIKCGNIQINCPCPDCNDTKKCLKGSCCELEKPKAIPLSVCQRTGYDDSIVNCLQIDDDNWSEGEITIEDTYTEKTIQDKTNDTKYDDSYEEEFTHRTDQTAFSTELITAPFCQNFLRNIFSQPSSSFAEKQKCNTKSRTCSNYQKQNQEIKRAREYKAMLEKEERQKRRTEREIARKEREKNKMERRSRSRGPSRRCETETFQLDEKKSLAAEKLVSVDMDIATQMDPCLVVTLAESLNFEKKRVQWQNATTPKMSYHTQVNFPMKVTRNVGPAFDYNRVTPQVLRRSHDAQISCQITPQQTLFKVPSRELPNYDPGIILPHGFSSVNHHHRNLEKGVQGNDRQNCLPQYTKAYDSPMHAYVQATTDHGNDNRTEDRMSHQYGRHSKCDRNEKIMYSSGECAHISHHTEKIRNVKDKHGQYTHPMCCNGNTPPTFTHANSVKETYSIPHVNRSISCFAFQQKDETRSISKSASDEAATKSNRRDSEKWTVATPLDDETRKMLILALGKMCFTMGEFSKQFRDLMGAMTETLHR